MNINKLLIISAIMILLAAGVNGIADIEDFLTIRNKVNLSVSGDVNATKFYGGFDGVPKNGTDASFMNANITQLNITQNISLNKDVNISPFFWLVDTPIFHNQVVPKGYVDDATSSTAFDFFFNTNESDIEGHFNMTESDLEGPEITIDSASLGADSTTTIFIWTTLVGQPEFNELRQGVYDAHIHLNKNLFGARDVIITPKLYNISGDGSKQTLLVTFESTSPLTTTLTEYDLHGVLSDPIMLADDARLSIQMEAVVSGGGSSPVVTVTLEGTTDSHLSVETSTNAFQKIFILRGGTNELLGDWFTGNFRIFGMRELRLANDKVNLSSTGDVNATSIYASSFFIRESDIGANLTSMNTTLGLKADRSEISSVAGFIANGTDANLTGLTIDHKINMSITGDVNASKFYGDGSGLTNIIATDGTKIANNTDAALNIVITPRINLTSSKGIGMSGKFVVEDGWVIMSIG